jgi:hypothetical protein
MQFVELTISSTKRYTYKAASNIEMNILGDFLASDVGYRSASFKQWASDNTSQNANGSLTALEKDNNYIILTDIFAEEGSPAALKITLEQYVKILNDWETQVCKLQPTEIIIKQENNEFIIESTIPNEDNNITSSPRTKTHPYPIVMPHSYPSWIKSGFIICCIFFIICLFDFPYYFKLHRKIKKARKTFDEQNYPDASIYFEKLSKILPNNKYVKRYLAQSLFKSDEINDHMIALNSLSKIQLSKHEWQELLNYMPIEYIAYFQDVKKDKRT